MKYLLLFLISFSIKLYAEENLTSKISKIENPDANILIAFKKIDENAKLISNIKSTDEILVNSTLDTLKLSVCAHKLIRNLKPEEQSRYVSLITNGLPTEVAEDNNNKARLENLAKNKEFTMTMLQIMMQAQEASIESVCLFPLDKNAPSLASQLVTEIESKKIRNELLSLKSKLHPSIQLLLNQSLEESESFSNGIQRFKENSIEQNVTFQDEIKSISKLSKNNFIDDPFNMENGEADNTFDKVLTKRILDSEKENHNFSNGKTELLNDEVFALLFEYYLKADEHYAISKMIDMDSSCTLALNNLFESKCKNNSLYSTKVKKHTAILLCADDNLSIIPKECNYSKIFLNSP